MKLDKALEMGSLNLHLQWWYQNWVLPLLEMPKWGPCTSVALEIPKMGSLHLRFYSRTVKNGFIAPSLDSCCQKGSLHLCLYSRAVKNGVLSPSLDSRCQKWGPCTFSGLTLPKNGVLSPLLHWWRVWCTFSALTTFASNKLWPYLTKMRGCHNF